LFNEHAGFDIDDLLRVKVCPFREKTTDDDEKKRLATTTVGFESIAVVF
tara:strand:- start:2650 stop:2796 length:147 start_codon:yes stop_codon:yes gene_type:complete